MDEKVWVPVEITEIGDGFLNAWQVGAKEWREAESTGKSGFFQMHDSWNLYEPVGLPGGATGITLPDSDQLVSVYLTEVIKYIDREIYPKMEKIQAQIAKEGETPKQLNRLGVLYARYGLNEKAEHEFNRALEIDRNYMPALMNLGNVYFLNNDPEQALEMYERASRRQPDNPKVLLSLARANHELENYGNVKRSYNKLKKLDPDLAVDYAYLDLASDDTTRASNMSRMKEEMLWEEE
jgi:tetratricopeptide (TPR) repeat protein